MLTSYYIQGGEYYLQEAIKLSDIVVDNLIRLRIIDIPADEHFAYSSLYDQLFDYAKKDNNIADDSITYDKKVLKITDFGKNFIDICLS